MKITIVGRKLNVRDSFKELAEKKLKKVEKFFGDDAQAKVTVSAAKSSQMVEITINSKSMIFRAEETAENMNEALDYCVDSLIRQIRKNKTKIEKRMHSGSITDFFDDLGEVDEETDFDLIRRKEVQLKPEMVDEAILQMNMLGHEFYMFINGETDKVNVVYKRKNGGYGLIEPEQM